MAAVDKSRSSTRTMSTTCVLSARTLESVTCPPPPAPRPPCHHPLAPSSPPPASSTQRRARGEKRGRTREAEYVRQPRGEGWSDGSGEGRGGEARHLAVLEPVAVLGEEEAVELLLHGARLDVGHARHDVALLLDDCAVFADAHLGVIQEVGVVHPALPHAPPPAVKPLTTCISSLASHHLHLHLVQCIRASTRQAGSTLQAPGPCAQACQRRSHHLRRIMRQESAQVLRGR